MDEAVYVVTGRTMGAGTAVLGRATGEIADDYIFRCPDDTCNVDVQLKARKSTMVYPYFGAVESHQPDCEYAARSARRRTRGTAIALSGGFTLVAGGKQNDVTNAPTQTRNVPVTPPQRRSSRLTLRALMDLTQTWEPSEFESSTMKVSGQDRLTSHLFLKAEWLGSFDVTAAGSVRWPRWMGPARFADVSRFPHIVFGPAIATAGNGPPAIQWLNQRAHGRPVTLASAPTLFARSCYQRRFRRDLDRIGWTAEAGARCIAVVLGTARENAGSIVLTPAGSYEDVYLFAESDLNLANLEGALAAREAAFLRSVDTMPARVQPRKQRFSPPPLIPPERSTRPASQAIPLSPVRRALPTPNSGRDAGGTTRQPQSPPNRSRSWPTSAVAAAAIAVAVLAAWFIFR